MTAAQDAGKDSIFFSAQPGHSLTAKTGGKADPKSLMSSSNIRTCPSILIIGYGNPMRSDDGLGIYMAELLEKECLQDVEIRTCHQLTPEWVEEMVHYKHVMFLDAGYQEEDFKIENFEEKKSRPISSSHHLQPSVLMDLAENLYGKKLSLTLCTLKGENFDFGSEISDSARRRAEFCLKALQQHIREALHA